MERTEKTPVLHLFHHKVLRRNALLCSMCSKKLVVQRKEFEPKSLPGPERPNPKLIQCQNCSRKGHLGAGVLDYTKQRRYYRKHHKK